MNTLEIHDDVCISDSEILWRRIDSQFIVPVKGQPDIRRVSSGAFQNSTNTGSMSVSIESLVHCEPDEYLRNFNEIAIVSFNVGFVRSVGQGIIKKETQIDPSHGEVVGAKTKTVRKKFANNFEWVIEPQDGINGHFSSFL